VKVVKLRPERRRQDWVLRGHLTGRYGLGQLAKTQGESFGKLKEENGRKMGYSEFRRK
jgi:hypothetical protein